MTLSPARNSRGLSIVELIVALALLSGVAFGIYESFLAAGRGGRHAEMRVKRDLYAQQALAEIMAASHDQLAAWTPPAEFNAVPGFDDFQIRYRTERLGSGLLQVTIDVAPPDAGNPAIANAAETLSVSGVKAP